MDIRIKKIELTSFKCFRYKEIHLNDDITTIRGRNGVGKTTIADAILWCLFGKNLAGQSDFDLKTKDSSGTIPNLDHSVELVLCVRNLINKGEDEDAYFENIVTLKRTLKETWVKKRGSDEQVFKNNTTEYLVNGDAVTAGDFKKYINSLVSEDVFRSITNPQYFTSLKWQEQRRFLEPLAGDISNDEIATTDDLKALIEDMSEDIIAYRKHLSYQIKQIKDKLDKIPVRIEELNKTLPEPVDADAICLQENTLKKEYDEMIGQISDIEGGDAIARSNIKKEIDAISKQILDYESKVRESIFEQQREKDQKLNKARNQFGEITRTQIDLQQKVGSYDTLVERCNQTIKDCEADAEIIRKEWKEATKPFTLTEDVSICPTCGQPLPQEQLQETIEKLKETYNTRKEDAKKRLTEKANKVKEIKAKAEKQIEEYNSQKEADIKALSEYKDRLNEAHSEVVSCERIVVPELKDALSSDETYQNLVTQLENTRKELESVSLSEDSKNQIAQIKEQLDENRKQREEVVRLRSVHTQYEEIINLRTKVEDERDQLISQLSELERKEDLARQYQERQNTILEERINQHFSLVKWKLFKTVNNGGDPHDEPFCECYVDGVAYHDGLNQASRLNAGLDILNTLCRHYNVSAPIVIDQSESTLNILETIGQQVRLQVADTDLQII